MSNRVAYEPLTPESLVERLGQLDAVTSRLGPDHSQWTVHEVGDGNLNLVFIVAGTKGSVIVKQALPYVRLVGDSWPLPLYRAFFENCALTRQAQRTLNCVPEVFHFDDVQAMIIMEHLTPHVILRNKLIKGERVKLCMVVCEAAELMLVRAHPRSSRKHSAAPPTAILNAVLISSNIRTAPDLLARSRAN